VLGHDELALADGMGGAPGSQRALGLDGLLAHGEGAVVELRLNGRLLAVVVLGQGAWAAGQGQRSADRGQQQDQETQGQRWCAAHGWRPPEVTRWAQSETVRSALLDPISNRASWPTVTVLASVEASAHRRSPGPCAAGPLP